MAILTADQFRAAGIQRHRITSPAGFTTTSLANSYFSTFGRCSDPAAVSQFSGSTTQGVVPVPTDGGYPILAGFDTKKGYLASVELMNSVNTRVHLFDRVFYCGNYAHNGGTYTLSSQPSYSSRLPGGSYAGTQIWFEGTTGYNGGTPTVEVTYTNQDGSTGRTTGAISVASAPTARAIQLPLAAGDTGVQTIESVIATSNSALGGAFNIAVVRPLWHGMMNLAPNALYADILKTSLIEVFEQSCISMYVATTSATNWQQPDVEFTVAVG